MRPVATGELPFGLSVLPKNDQDLRKLSIAQDDPRYQSKYFRIVCSRQLVFQCFIMQIVLLLFKNVLRGKCWGCTECDSFISVSGLVLCDYCGCPPVQHEKTEEERSSGGASAILSSEIEDEDGPRPSTSTQKSRFEILAV